MYSHETLLQMKSQVVKDIWHGLIGKPPGTRNTTGLKTMEDVIQAILKAQEDPGFLLVEKAKRTSVETEKQEEPMPPKRKPSSVPPSIPKKSIVAVESQERPLTPSEVKRVVVRRLFVGEKQYFLESETNSVYAADGGTPGHHLGYWNASSKTIQALERPS